ncbi:MAG: tRNA (guanosine(46)-N7)-methyltransferase TrmB [Pseudomonadota bacterium]
MQDQHHKSLHYYGRRRSRRLRASHHGLIETLYPKYDLSAYCSKLLKKDHLKSIFGNRIKRYRLEIGFGAGEHLVQSATNNKNVGFIGIEPFKGGQAKLLASIKKHQVTNIRLFNDDVWLLFDCFADGLFEKIYLHFPDPWPKKRHHKRRMIQFDSIMHFARILQPNSQLQIASDHHGYLNWILLHFHFSQNYFKWLNVKPDQWFNPPNQWVETRYQQKALQQNRPTTYLIYQKVQ